MSEPLIHPAAKTFPVLTKQEYTSLVASIKANGLRVPITVDSQGQIIDGRHRWKACQEAGVKPRYQTLGDGENPYAYVWDINAEGRVLPETTKATIRKKNLNDQAVWRAQQEKAPEEANRKRSEATKQQPRTPDGKRLAGKVSSDTTPDKEKDVDRERKRVAKEIGTSEATAGRIIALEKRAPDLFEKVARNEMKLGEATRQLKKREVSKKVAELPKGKYRVFYADPPWKYGNSGEGIDHMSPAEKIYPCMSITELCALDIKSMAHKDAVLFLWVTSPLLEECFDVIRAWGFKYKTSFVWDKVRDFFGHYNSVRHEFLLICTRGSCTPDIDKKIDSVVTIEKTKNHSEKPEEFRQIIDTLYPHGPRIELFARKKVDGWEAYGNEL